MRIAKLHIHNFRVYGSDVKLTLERKPNKPLVVVGGHNGFGKSTFITSVLWCLYGKLMAHVDAPFERMIRNAGGYPAFREGCLNRHAGAPEYFVELVFHSVELPGLSCQEMIMRRSFDGKKERLSLLLDGMPNDLVDSIGYDLFVQEYILPKEVARFFLFDAERITNLAESRGAQERKELASAYEKVLGVNRYLEVKNQVDAIRERLLVASTSAEAQKQLDALDGEIEELKGQNEAAEIELQELEEEKVLVKADREEKALSLMAHGFVGDAKDLEALKDREGELKESIVALGGEVKASMDVAPLLLSPTWTNALMAEIVKAQGLSLKEEQWKTLSKEIKNWIGFGTAKEARSLIQFLKGQLQNEGDTAVPLPSAEEVSQWSEQLNWLKGWMKQKQAQLKRDRAELSRVQGKLRKLNQSGSNKDAQATKEQVDALDAQLEEMTLKRAKNELLIDQNNRQLQALYRKRAEALKLIEVDTRNAKKDTVLRSLKEKLDLFVMAFKEQRRKNLEERIGAALREMMHKQHLFDHVSIDLDESGMDLQLVDRHGDLIPKDSLSMGEKQLYAIALLKALIDESGMQFPVVIDSPLQKLDEEHAMNLLRDVFPALSEQVFILPIPGKELSPKEHGEIEHLVHSMSVIRHEEGGSEIRSVSKSEFFAMEDELVWE